MEEGFYLAGEVRKVEQVSGNRADGSAYQFMVVHVLTDVDVYECTLAREWKGQVPAKGDRLTFRVRVRAFKRGAGMAVLGIDLLAVVGVADEADSEPARALASV